MMHCFTFGDHILEWQACSARKPVKTRHGRATVSVPSAFSSLNQGKETIRRMQVRPPLQPFYFLTGRAYPSELS